jgi:hypothetical protein
MMQKHQKHFYVTHWQQNTFDIFVFDHLSLYIFMVWKSIVYNLFCSVLGVSYLSLFLQLFRRCGICCFLIYYSQILWIFKRIQIIRKQSMLFFRKSCVFILYLCFRVWRKSVFDIHFTEFGAVMTTALPVLFKYCYKYCYGDSRKFWAVMQGGGLAL